MPSQDNTYRFQNTDRVSEKPKSGKGKSIGKTILFGAIFGLVAAACFGIVVKVGKLGISGGSGSLGGTEVNPVEISSVSGSAVGVSDVSGIVENVMPAIVSITERSTVTSYFGQSYSAEGAGSGFIVKQDDGQLLIVTNNHVVSGADKISVQFNDGESAEAEIKGTSESNDLAVLTVDMDKLKDSTKSSIKVASLGSSDDAKVGEMVIAIGNALGYGQSVTVGYLSAKDREITASDDQGHTTTQILLQTDAAINPGNSGGALIDTNGKVIGINSSKLFSYGGSTVEGMSHAIPM
ncbi:MAG: trypsin-like peptidase domain-containing protein, partial [Eubacterium sp.]|nr:trypsin-like peptidase domain-containing protein [Eubacterium sp.]